MRIGALALVVVISLIGPSVHAQPAAPPGCEAAPLTIPPLTNAQGAPIRPWLAARDDRVADEGAQLLQAFDAQPADASRQSAIRAWASRHTDHPLAHYVLGRMCSQLGQDAEAIAAYGAALRIAPGFADAEYNLGVMLVGTGHADDAITHFDRAAALDPQHLDAFYNAGMALYLGGHYDRALAHWCAARRVGPDDFGSAKKVVQALNALGRFADAERARAAVIELHRRSADPRVRALQSYVIDQRRVGDEDVMIEEVFPPGGDSDLQYFYRFACSRGRTVVRTVTLEGSAVAREQGVAAIVGVEMPDGSHSTTSIMFRSMPTYEALRPIALDLIGRLQRGDRSAIGATSRPVQR